MNKKVQVKFTVKTIKKSRGMMNTVSCSVNFELFWNSLTALMFSKYQLTLIKISEFIYHIKIIGSIKVHKYII